MSHSLTKIWIHAIFGTKDRQPLIKKTVSDRVYEYIRAILEDLECPVNIVNGVEDHTHILFQLSPSRALAEVMQNIKGKSSHWINQENLLRTKFAWQKGYGAFSVSESAVTNVRNYIRDQEKRHKRMSFSEEYSLFLERYGIDGNR